MSCADRQSGRLNCSYRKLAKSILWLGWAGERLYLVKLLGEQQGGRAVGRVSLADLISGLPGRPARPVSTQPAASPLLRASGVKKVLSFILHIQFVRVSNLLILVCGQEGTGCGKPMFCDGAGELQH